MMTAGAVPLDGRPANPARRALGLLVVAWGAQAIITQSLLLREALVLMFGSELAWGLILFAWLLGVAGGALVGGRLGARATDGPRAAAWLAGTLLALTLVALIDLWAIRGARAWLGVQPGELLPIPQTALAALLFVAPTGALVGLAFPLAARIGLTTEPGAAPHPPALSLGSIYALESAGSLLGGAAFSFWAVEHLSSLQTILLSGAVTLAAATFTLARQAAVSRALPFLYGGLATAAAIVAIAGGETLERRLVERRWHQIAPGYELVTSAESKYQNLALGRRAGQFSLYCDGQATLDFPDPYTLAPLAHLWLCQHPDPRHVLILGSGAEGLLAEVLRHPVETVDYVELDARQIDLLRPYLGVADQAALADPRVTIHAADARHFAKSQRNRYDLVIARLPEPTTAQRARFYTADFLGELQQAMTAEAVLCFTATAAPTELSPTVRDYLAALRATLARHFPVVVIGWDDPAQVLVATAPDLITTDPAELSARYHRRQVRSPHFDPAWFDGATDWLAPEKLARRSADLDQVASPTVSTDLRPFIYMQRLTLWEAATGKSRVVAGLCTIRVGWLVAAAALGSVLVLLAGRQRHGGHVGWAAGAVTLSVLTTGLVTMALSILWLFAFQNLYGYVYQRLGWIVALFMAGLAIGCLLAGRTGGRWRALVVVDFLLAALTLSIPVLLPALAQTTGRAGNLAVIEAVISLMVVTTGILGGAAFALAAGVQLRLTGGVGATAGRIVGADNVGACLGALLCGLVLVPVFGLVTTAALLAGLKIGSAVVLLLTARFARAPA